MSLQHEIHDAAKRLEEAKDGCLECAASSDWQPAATWAARLVEAAQDIERTITDNLMAKPR